MNTLYLRNLLFTILHPGIVAGLIPYLIIKYTGNKVMSLGLPHYLGTIIFLIGLYIMFSCILRFATEGKGTLSPVDPTQILVVNGLYRYSRNPMYLGVISILIGEIIFFQSVYLFVYTLMVFILFNTFIKYVEEPRLKKDFGKQYKAYLQTVRRWI